MPDPVLPEGVEVPPAEPSAVVDDEGKELPTGFRGLLMPVNTRTGDGREMLLAEGAEPSVRPYPLALKAQKLSAAGHDNAGVVGIITRVWLEADGVHGEGPLDLADPDARAWARQLRDGFAGWVSADLDDVDFEEVPLGPDGEEVDIAAVNAEWEAFDRAVSEAIDKGEDPEAIPVPEEPEIKTVLLRFTKWKLMGATLVADAAFEQARIEPVFGEDFTPVDAEGALVAAAAEHSGAMIALVPSAEDAARLAVDGYEPEDVLHTTLVFLGASADWSPEARDALEEALTGLSLDPQQADIWGHAAFNPAGDDPCAVYLVQGDGLVGAHEAALGVLEETAGLPSIPDQHETWVAHITAGYGLAVSELSEVGTVRFDRLRLAFGDAEDVRDIPLDTIGESLVAGATPDFSSSDFTIPEADELTAVTVDDDGRVFGHLADWSACHIGFADCINPPAGCNYDRYFHTGQVVTERGRVNVGRITLGTGHAPTRGISPRAAAEHYDNTGSVVAAVRVHDGALGPWMSGRLVPGVSKDKVDAMMLAGVSGDWRSPRRGMPKELFAALSVNVPGFPVPRAKATATEQGDLALVAAGFVAPNVAEVLRRRETVSAAARRMSEADVRSLVRSALTEIGEEKERRARIDAAAAPVREARVASARTRIFG
jgi:2'-5' RNA ligase